MTRFNSVRPLVVFLATAGILALSARAAAEERPYFASGTAQFASPSSTDFAGAGQATHLGHYSEVGSANFSPTDVPGILRIDALSIYTAANGDRLNAIITGQLDGATGAINATVTYVGGTGRFENATGAATLIGQILPDGTISVTVKGTINY